MTAPGGDETAIDVHANAIIIDTVNRSVIDSEFLNDVATGGLTAIGRTILVTDPGAFTPFGFMETVREIALVLEAIDRNPQLMLITSVDDIHRAKATARTGLYFYLQSPEPINRQLWRLRLFYHLGLRVLQLTFNERSLTGDGCAEANDAGLSDFGLALIRECERMGIVIDLSHCGDRTTNEAIAAAEKPVLITHAMSRTLFESPRCKSDSQVVACARKGGVIGVQASPIFIGDRPHTIEGMLDHVDYYVSIVGIDHVGIGLDLTTGNDDYDPAVLGFTSAIYGPELHNARTLPGIQRLADVPNITASLLRRGYSANDVSAILGGNVLRVFGEVWRPV